MSASGLGLGANYSCVSGCPDQGSPFPAVAPSDSSKVTPRNHN